MVRGVTLDRKTDIETLFLSVLSKGTNEALQRNTEDNLLMAPCEVASAGQSKKKMYGLNSN